MASRRARMIAGGDVMLGRALRCELVQRGAAYPFELIRPVLESADLRFANLECVLPESGKEVQPSSFDMWAPWESAVGLAAVPFDVLSLANNHILDHGDAAARATVAFCRRHGLTPVGFGESPREARCPEIVERAGLRLAFLAYADDAVGLARQRHPGPAYLDPAAMCVEISAARALADVVVVSLHADLEYVHYPAPWRVSLCRRLVEAGATLVLGHHPHVAQGLELYQDGLIAYSLGNLVYDVTVRPVMVAALPATAQSFLLEVDLAPGRVVAHRLHPYQIDEVHRPVPLLEEEAVRLKAAISGWSRVLADPVQLEEMWVETCLAQLGKEMEALSAAVTREGGIAAFASMLPRYLFGQYQPFAREVYGWLLHHARAGGGG